MTSKVTAEKSSKSTNVLLEVGIAGNSKESLILCHQVRAIDTSQFGKKVGLVPEDVMAEVEEALAFVLGL